MKYSFHPESEIEFNASIDYYEECKQNLGLDFTNEVYKTIQRILSFPTAWHILDKDSKKMSYKQISFWNNILSKR